MNRKALNRRLWSLVRHIPGGEETMRDMVARLRQEDGTGQELLGTEAFTSTLLLSDAQFERLLDQVEQRSNPPRRRRSRGGNVSFMVSPQERAYLKFMFHSLGWSLEAQETFIARQTRGKGIKTHRQASAVIEPLERILMERGWRFSEDPQGRKWWDQPEEPQEKACCSSST